MIKLDKDSMKKNLCVLADSLFSLPEVECIKIKEVEIRAINKDKMIDLAMDECFHDCYSDVDLCVVVKLSAEGGVSPDEYLKHIEHWGFPWETILAYPLRLKAACTELYSKMGCDMI